MRSRIRMRGSARLVAPSALWRPGPAPESLAAPMSRVEGGGRGRERMCVLGVRLGPRARARGREDHQAIPRTRDSSSP